MRRSQAPSSASSINIKPKINSSLSSNTINVQDREKLIYEILYTKKSLKKHKIWTDDGYLVLIGSNVKLLDSRQSTITEPIRMKQDELKQLEIGSIISLGSYEVNIISVILDLPQKVITAPKILLQDERNQKPKLSSISLMNRRNIVNKLAVPVTDSDRLIMPLPPDDFMLEKFDLYDTNEVFLEGVIANRLRIHQRDGIIFLYRVLLAYNYKPFNGISGAMLCDEMGLGKTVQAICIAWILMKNNPFNRNIPLVKRVLVVVPGSLIQNWRKEVCHWIGREKLTVFCVDKNNRLEDYVKSSLSKFTVPPMLILSYEMLVQKHELLKKLGNYDLLICDEAHRLKNPNCKTVQIIESLNIKKRLLLTGTPIQNDLTELWNLAQLCAPNVLAPDFVVFKEKIIKPLSNLNKLEFSSEELLFEIIDKSDELGSISSENQDLEFTESKNLLQNQLAKFFLRRTSYLNLKHMPVKRENILFCSNSKLQLDLQNAIYSWASNQFQTHKRISSEYTLLELEKDLFSNAAFSDSEEAEEVSKQNGSSSLFTALNFLRKLYNHPILLKEYFHNHEKEINTTISISLINKLQNILSRVKFMDEISNIYYWDLSGKCSLLFLMLVSFFKNCPKDSRIVLISSFTKTLDLLEKLCLSAYNKVNQSDQKASDSLIVRIDGSLLANKRQAVVEAFNCKQKGFRIHGPRVLLLSKKAGGVGLNLIGANFLVLFDQDWNPANDEQALARIWRDGQKKDCYLYRLVTSNSLEERMFQRQLAKCGLSDCATIVGRKRSLAGQLSQDELKKLFDLPSSELKSNWTHRLIGCKCSDSNDLDNSVLSEQMKEDLTEERECQIFLPGEDKKDTENGSSLSKIDQWTHLLTRDQIFDAIASDPLLQNLTVKESSDKFLDSVFFCSTKSV